MIRSLCTFQRWDKMCLVFSATLQNYLKLPALPVCLTHLLHSASGIYAEHHRRQEVCRDHSSRSELKQSASIRQCSKNHFVTADVQLVVKT